MCTYVVHVDVRTFTGADSEQVSDDPTLVVVSHPRGRNTVVIVVDDFTVIVERLLGPEHADV